MLSIEAQKTADFRGFLADYNPPNIRADPLKDGICDCTFDGISFGVGEYTIPLTDTAIRRLRPGDRQFKVGAQFRALLRRLLQADEVRADLADGMPALPAWMQDLLRPLIGPGPSGS